MNSNCKSDLLFANKRTTKGSQRRELLIKQANAARTHLGRDATTFSSGKVKAKIPANYPSSGGKINKSRRRELFPRVIIVESFSCSTKTQKKREAKREEIARLSSFLVYLNQK
jgi:hypothetical protein